MIDGSAILFYVFSGILLTSAMMVVTARNTIHSVLFLILAFFNAAGLFVLAHAEFLAMILVIVYVGAVAVLFLFVVMMLDVHIHQLRSSVKSYTLMGCLVGSILAIELIFLIFNWKTSSSALDLTTVPLDLYKGMSNTEALGNLLYTHYALAFQGAGLILLIAMIGAVALTLRHREGVKKQKVGDQLSRQAKESLQLVDIPSRSGI